jgi:Glycosyl transferases group 1
VPLRKDRADLFRYRDVAAEQRAVSQRLSPRGRPHPGLRGLDAITTRKHPAARRTVKAFNPVARPDFQLFVALMSGEHAVPGFANRDLRAKLPGHLGADPRPQSAQVSRLLHRLHVYGLIATIARSRRWRVTVFGHRVMGAMPALLAACDVFALPSFEEPFGLVFLEAMAMKRPVVALANGGALEVVEHERSGLLSVPGDQLALATNLLTLLKDPALRTSIGESGRHHVETRFTLARMARDAERVYEALARPPAASLAAAYRV